MGECFIWSYNRCSALLVAVHVCRHNQRGTLHAVSYIGCPYKMWHFFRSDMCMWKDHLKMWRPELKKSYLSVASSNVPSCINIILCMFAISTFRRINRAPKLGSEFKKWAQWVLWLAGDQNSFVAMLGLGWGLYWGCVMEKTSLQRKVRWRGEQCCEGDGCSGMYRGLLPPSDRRERTASQTQINASVLLTLPHISEASASLDIADTCSFFNFAFQEN